MRRHQKDNKIGGPGTEATYRAQITTLRRVKEEQGGSQGEIHIPGPRLPGWDSWHLRNIKEAWRKTREVEVRQDSQVWKALWRTNWPAGLQEFAYKVLWKKLMVSERVKVIKSNITTDCTWCGYEETTYHVTKACTVTHTLAQAIRTLHCTAVIGGVEVGRLISDAPLTSLASVPGQCLWWGLQKIWLLRCQRVMRRIQVNVQDLYAAMCATFMDAAAWFQQAGEQDVSALADKLSLWYLSKQQSLAAAERQELLREWDRRKGASAQVGQGMGKRLRLIRERAAGQESRKRARG